MHFAFCYALNYTKIQWLKLIVIGLRAGPAGWSFRSSAHIYWLPCTFLASWWSGWQLSSLICMSRGWQAGWSGGRRPSVGMSCLCSLWVTIWEAGPGFFTPYSQGSKEQQERTRPNAQALCKSLPVCMQNLLLSRHTKKDTRSSPESLWEMTEGKQTLLPLNLPLWHFEPEATERKQIQEKPRGPPPTCPKAGH